MKKKLFAIFLALTMIFSLTGCGTDSSVDVAALEEKIDALTQQVETLSGRLDMLEQKSGLQSWALIPTAWSNGGGASVRLTAVPVTYADGQSASFSVRLNNQEIINTPCTWDGTTQPTAPAILPLLSWKPQTATATSAVFLPLMAPGNSSP